MSELKSPAIDPASVAAVSSSSYPEPFRSRMGDRVKRRLGDACGLSHFGVNLVTLGPGGQSALRHWHSHEDEFIYVLSGELTLITNEGEQTLTAGMAAGFAAGVENGHHFINRSDQPARYLEIGDRIAADQAHYPDDDLIWHKTEDGEIAAHKDGTPYP